jgi:hypothetical protein
MESEYFLLVELVLEYLTYAYLLGNFNGYSSDCGIFLFPIASLFGHRLWPFHLLERGA